MVNISIDNEESIDIKKGLLIGDKYLQWELLEEREESDDLILNTKIMYKYKTSKNIIKNFIRNKLDNFENVNIDMKIPAENLAIFCCDDIKLSCIGNRTGLEMFYTDY